MFPNIRHGIIAVSLLSGMAAAGCAPIHVSSFTETGVAFTFRTYAWAAEDGVPTGDPRLDNNRFFSERVRDAVDRELAARGYEKTTAGSPDLVLHYHASITQDIALTGTTNGVDPVTGTVYSVDNCQNCGASVYDAGSLIIDFVDARTSRLVWRGWAEKVDPVIDNQDWMEETIDTVVAKIMTRLPARS